MEFINYSKTKKSHRKFHKLISSLIVFSLCAIMIVGCSEVEQVTKGYTFISDENLDQYVESGIYEKVISEPIGAAPPELCFFNKDIVCLLNYNGLLIFDNKTGGLKDAIDIQGLGFNQTQGSSAILIRGNDDYVTLTTVDNSEGYIYDIASSKLGKIGNVDNIEYTEIKTPEQKKLNDLNGIDSSKEMTALESKDGIATCYINYNNLAETKFIIYGTDQKVINEFTMSK